MTPRFPDGYTVLSAEGRWRDETTGAVEEPSRVLIIMHRATAETNGKIEQIRRRYIEQFEQQAVLRADEVQKVSF